jgi:zinc protease
VRGPARLLAAAVLAALAVALAPAPARAEADVTRTRLPNGFTVIVRENPLAPVVALSLMVRMGTRWETAENNGISNFVHAVMVKGTTKHDGGALADLVTGLGGRMSASGDVDYSEIRASALSRFWRELLELTAEVALHPKLDPADVDSERDWLLGRIQRQRDNPSARAFDDLYLALYGDHPYARPVLGTPASLRRIDHAALVAWYRRFYRPHMMTLAVSGQVRAAEVVAEARRLFGDLPGGPRPPQPRSPAPAAKSQRLVVEAPAQQAQILVGALAPSLDQPDHAPVKVLATVLGGGMAGRLFAVLRDREALAYTATAFYDPVREPGALVLYLGTAPANAERAEAGLAREVARIRSERVGADELARAKGFLLGNYAMDRRTNARQAWYLAFYDVEGVPDDYPERYRRAVEAVTADDVLRVARTYLRAVTTFVLRPPAAR